MSTRGRVAVTIADPMSYRSAQLKGRVDVVRELNDDDCERVDTHIARFAEALLVFGMPGVECSMLGNLVAVEFDPEGVYDQTSGANAGKALM